MTLIYFIILIGVLIFVHELGHFVVAKAFGVKVLKFSLGFGPKAAGFRRGETEYVLAWIPLGGFVKMVGEDPREEVEPADFGRAFHQKPIWQRFCVICAGPFFNLLLPVLIYFAFFAAQSERDPAIIGKAFAGQPAAEVGLRPGDKIVAVNGEAVRYWEDLQRAISDHGGERLRLTVERDGARFDQLITPKEHALTNRLGMVEHTGLIGISPFFNVAQIGIEDPQSPAARAGLRTGDVITAVNGEKVSDFVTLERLLTRRRQGPLQVSYARPGLDVVEPEQLAALSASDTTIELPLVANAESPHRVIGIHPAEMFVRTVQPETPAAAIGLKPGDRIIVLDGQPMNDWDVFTLALLHAADKTREHELAWVSYGGAKQQARFRLKATKVVDEYKQEHEEYVFGADNHVLRRQAAPVPIENRLTYAATMSVRQTAEIVGMTAYAIVQLIRGSIPRESIGGPLILAHTARVAAEHGWDTFLWMMALISINLAIFNLLPIPILDGGHLIFLLAEAAYRRPLSLRVREIATYVGLFFLVSLMLFAFKNDIVALWLRPQ